MTIKVVVADDSLFMRKLISNLLQEDKELDVVGTASNGEEAVQKVQQLRPDVVTMDVEMPKLNGLEAVKRIMSSSPVPIVMLSSLTNTGAHVTIEALHYGAIDFLQKPSGTISIDLHKIRRELIGKVKMAAQAKVHGAGMQQASPVHLQKSTPLFTQKMSHSDALQVIAIGTSTGGPSALSKVIPKLQADLPVAVLVVQHMPPLFTKSLAARLNSESPMRVVEAKHNEVLKQGTVYIAPGSHHMVISQSAKDIRVLLDKKELRNGHRPSVDVLFESVAKLRNVTTHYVLMTGMGNDGANGMLAGKQAGASSTIAESKDTCVVYGMPKVAVELNCVDYVLPVQSIANKITRVVQSSSRPLR